MSRSLLSIAYALLLAMAFPALANQRAHVHGEGQVQIAIDGRLVFIALQSPGADIVGFEHAARSDAEKAAVAAALSRLGDPLQILGFDDEAGCRVRQATAGIVADPDEHEDHAEPAHDDHGHQDAHAEHAEPGPDDPANPAHGSFSAEYEFECADIGALRRIEFTYFRHFHAAQRLDVVLIDDMRQIQVELDRDDPVLRLDR